MNWIEKMIAEQCPNGVKKVKLGEVGAFENIGTDKKIVEGEQLVTLLNYVDIYHHKKISPSIPNMVVSANDKKIESCTVEKGDVFVTPTSETPDDIGHSAVITQSIPNAVYSYHIMRYRQFTHNMTTSYYINYCFDSISVQKQIQKKAQGITRFGLSKDKFASIEIPLPPLSIQKEIVSVFDKFSELIEKTDEEIALRQKQYEYYREKLLTFEKGEVEWKKLGKVCDILTGFPFKSSLFSKKGIRLMRGMNVKRGYFDFNDEDDRYWPDSNGLEKYLLAKDDIIISMDGSLVGKSFCILEEKHLPLLLVQRVARIRTTLCNIHYIYQNIKFRFADYVDKKKTAGAIPHVSQKDIENLEIPLPSPSRQQEIVATLDKFEALISKLKEERELRQKQYEYYREKLLTF